MKYIDIKRVIPVLLFLFALQLSAQQDTLKYRICLKDKAATTYSPDRPEEFLSERAVMRRMRQHLSVDSTDLPVCRVYVNAIRQEGVTIVTQGKWENFVTVSCNDTSIIERIAALPFVRSTERVWRSPSVDSVRTTPLRRPLSDTPDLPGEQYYGEAFNQIAISKGHRLHDAGYRGEGMMIAVMDAGFHNVDRIAAFEKSQILGVKDFVGDSDDIFAEGDHGLKVLSCMAADLPFVMVGTAPKASYWLLRTEDEASEHLVEQDYWAAAIEFADSVGVDIVNSSLGYYAFDDASKNYRLRDLDGKTALISRQASRAAGKGMLVCVSAGNSGAGSWKKVTPPGDANHVLTVGAIDYKGRLAGFSSIGNTSDGRIKPDVVAVGNKSAVLAPNGLKSTANGTSFATPILCGMVACFWQAYPGMTAFEVIDRIRLLSDRADFPDNIFGYGVPEFRDEFEHQGVSVER